MIMDQRAYVKELHFPVGGVYRRFGYQNQPPYTTPDAQNVWPFDTLENRERGGRRAGLTKHIDDRSSNNPVQLLIGVTTVDAESPEGLDRYLFGATAGSSHYVHDGTWYNVAGLLTTDSSDYITTDGGDRIKIGSGSVASSVSQIGAAVRGQKVYIGDFAKVRVNGSDGTVASGNTLSSPSVSDWTALSIDTDRDVVVIEYENGRSETFGIVELADELTIDGTADNGSVSYSVRTGIKVFDPHTGIMRSLVPTSGAIPSESHLICRYRDRIVVANGNLWYMCRQANPEDWDYGADPDDPGRAIAGNLADAGMIGDVITAMMPHSDDYLVFGCEHSLWVLRGDPCFGGNIDNLAEGIGVVGPYAWCKLPDARMLFLSKSGLHTLPPGGNAYPSDLSQEALPDDLKNVNGQNNAVSLGYDIRHDGVLISIVPIDGSTGTHWWLDMRNGGFWPIVFADDGHQPFRMTVFEGQLIFGCVDGYLRYFDSDATQDDDEDIDAYVTYGPMRIGPNGYQRGVLRSISATLDRDSERVDWEVRAGTDGEEAYETTRSYASGTFGAGRNREFSCRVGGGAYVVKLSGRGKWAIEQLRLEGQAGGRQRL